MTSKEKANELSDKHYWAFGDGYMGTQHIIHAIFEVDGILQELNNHSGVWESIVYFREVKRRLEAMK